MKSVVTPLRLERPAQIAQPDRSVGCCRPGIPVRLAACGLAIALAAPPERILDPGIVAVAWGEEESVAAAGHAEGGAAPEGIQTIAAILALPATDRAARRIHPRAPCE